MRQAVKNIEEAKAILKEHKAAVVQRYRVSELGIFGSFVRGEQKKRTISISLLSSMKKIFRDSLSSARWKGISKDFSEKKWTWL
jgi:predicted nucleotidyltransferase